MFVVLGASGNVGSKVATLLLKKEQKLRVVGRNPDKLKDFKPQGAEVMLGPIGDPKFLSQCLYGAQAAFVMVPPDYHANSLATHYQGLSESIEESLRNSGVRYVVNLSSFGAEHSAGTGPIRFLHEHEERLNRLESSQVVHLRPAFFMENLLSFAPSIRSQRSMSSCLKADLAIPMIAALDVARVAVEKMLTRDFQHQSTQMLLGPRDVSLSEVCQLLSRVLGYTVFYQQLSDKDCERDLIDGGMAPGVAKIFLELYQAYNSGFIKLPVARDSLNKNMTPIEDFLKAFRGLLKEEEAELLSKQEFSVNTTLH